MRIGFLSRCLTHGAGVGRYARSLLRAMTRITADELIALSNKKLSGLAESVRVIVSRRSNIASILLWEQFDVPRIIRREKIDVLYNPDFVLPLRCPCPGVVTVHDISYVVLPQYAGLRAKLYYGSFVARSVKSARRVMTVSEFSRRAIRDYFDVDERKLAVAYPAADEKFHPGYSPADVQVIRRKYNIEREYILYVGLLGGWKNVEGLLQAYDVVRSQADRCCDLVLAGRTCPATRRIFAMAERLRLGRSLHVLPNVHDADLPLLYTGARLFAFPSLYEGFGLPPLEAMSCGTPVVCTSAGALPEVTGDAARHVTPGDTQELAEAILEVLHNDSVRSDLIGRGSRQAQKFSWVKCAQRVLEVFHQVANE